MVKYFSYYSGDDIEIIKKEVFRILAEDGMKLEQHAELFPYLKKAGYNLDEATGILKIPTDRMKEALAATPKTFTLGGRSEGREMPLPRPGGGFYGRPCTGGHSWIEPTGEYHRVTLQNVATWGRLSEMLPEMGMTSFLYPDDAPTYAADVYSMGAMIKNTAKHMWLQPYEAKNVSFLIELAKASAGGAEALKKKQAYSLVNCSVTPKIFKHMDLEITYQAAKNGLCIQACSLPGAGATSPITTAATVALVAAEILTMLAMGHAINPGTPVVACPIIFSTDMRNGMSLQSSPEAIKDTKAAIQFFREAFQMPTHDYGLGSDASYLGEQNMAERAMLLMASAMSGQDIMGGAGQMEVAVCVSPLQLIADNELLAITRAALTPVSTAPDQIASDIIKNAKPGDQFISSPHTFKFCRTHLRPAEFSRLTRDAWENAGRPSYQDALKARYDKLMAADNPGQASPELVKEIDAIVAAADKALKH